MNGEKEVTAEAAFTAEETSGDVDVTFEINAEDLAGKDIVVFETLTFGDITIGTHTDIEDTDQTIEFPEIGTQAFIEGTNSNVAEPRKDIVISDTVEYDNIGIMDLENVKNKGTEEAEESSNESSEQENTEQVENTEEMAEIPFKFSEDISEDVKAAFTEAVNNGNVDAFVLKGVLMDKETGKLFLVDGNEVTTVGTFNIDKESGRLQVDFPAIDGTELAGKHLVVYETLYYKDVPVAEHHDINDGDQTITISTPALQTGQNIVYVICIAATVMMTVVVLAGIRRRYTGRE